MRIPGKKCIPQLLNNFQIDFLINFEILQGLRNAFFARTPQVNPPHFGLMDELERQFSKDYRQSCAR